MMQKEFEWLTGVIVSTSEYALIEKAYMDCEDDKKTFCRQWVKNGGANMLSKERLAEIERLKAQVLTLQNEISALSEKLEKAQEWRFVVESQKTQSEYEEYEKDALSGIGRFLTDEEAVQVVADETGLIKTKSSSVTAFRLMKQIASETQEEPSSFLEKLFIFLLTICISDLP